MPFAVEVLIPSSGLLLFLYRFSPQKRLLSPSLPLVSLLETEANPAHLVLFLKSTFEPYLEPTLPRRHMRPSPSKAWTRPVAIRDVLKIVAWHAQMTCYMLRVGAIYGFSRSGIKTSLPQAGIEFQTIDSSS